MLRRLSRPCSKSIRNIPMNRLTDKIAIITGGGSGIGLATAPPSAEDGARVIVVDINDSHTILDLSPTIEYSLRIVVTTANHVDSAKKNAIQTCSPLAILVNVAGGSGRR